MPNTKDSRSCNTRLPFFLKKKKQFPVLYAKEKYFNGLCREPSAQLISEKLILVRGLENSLKDDPFRPQYSCVVFFRDVILRICLC